MAALRRAGAGPGRIPSVDFSHPAPASPASARASKASQPAAPSGDLSTFGLVAVGLNLKDSFVKCCFRFYKLGFFSQSFEPEIEDRKKIVYVTRNPWCERAAVGSRAGRLYPAQERTFGTRHCPHVFTTSLSRINHQLLLFGF